MADHPPADDTPSPYTGADMSVRNPDDPADDPAGDPPDDPACDPPEVRAGRAGRVGDGVDPWATIDRLHAWLETERAHGGREGLLLRVLKLSEEVGEVAQAVIGATGQNPRKGVSHTWDDVRSELCDVVITAMVALRTLAPDAREVFTAHLSSVAARSLDGPPTPPPATDHTPAGPPTRTTATHHSAATPPTAASAADRAPDNPPTPTTATHHTPAAPPTPLSATGHPPDGPSKS